MQLGNSINFVTRFCKTVVVCQMLNDRQNMVCFDRCWGVSTAELWLTGRAVFLLLSRRCTGGTPCDFIVTSCHHVVSIIWDKVCSLTPKGARFGMRITLAVVLVCPLVCALCVPRCLRSGSGVALNKQVHDKFVKTG